MNVDSGTLVEMFQSMALTAQRKYRVFLETRYSGYPSVVHTVP